MNRADPKITFGIIVLNGVPFIKYNVRALYPFAHQIIVVEGACPAASRVSTPDGHSTDGTLDVLRDLLISNDPEQKITIVTAEDEGKQNGFWTEKTEMSQAYAKRATGEFLWQIDSDEFYSPESMAKVVEILRNNRDITEIAFRTLNFWGGLDYCVDGILLRLGDRDFHRVFAWGVGFSYITHRPPTVTNSSGENLANIVPITAKQMADEGVFLHHYEYLLPDQVRNKAEYYSNADHCQGLRPKSSWAEECYMKLGSPYGVHNIYKWPSWLERYHGDHPPEILNMMGDLKTDGKVHFRHTDDIDRLLKKRTYIAGVYALKLLSPIVNCYWCTRLYIRQVLIALGVWNLIQNLRRRGARRRIEIATGK